MSKWQGDISPPRYRALQWEALEVGEYIVCGPQQRSRVQDARDRCRRLGHERNFTSRKLTPKECVEQGVKDGSVAIIRCT